MKKNKFTIINSTAVPLPIENIDTDQIIPARFLKATTREDFGKNLFIDWRQKPDFVLNNKKFGGKILVTGRNFGCGSSREHAAWALTDFGFKAVVSSFFADIFRNNSLNNNLLPVTVSQEFLNKLLKEIEKKPDIKIVIDLKKEIIIVPELNIKERFPIDPYKKTCLMNGLNDIDYILSLKQEIINFERACHSRGDGNPD